MAKKDKIGNILENVRHGPAVPGHAVPGHARSSPDVLKEATEMAKLAYLMPIITQLANDIRTEREEIEALRNEMHGLKTTEREVIDALRNEGLKTIEQMANDIRTEREEIEALRNEMHGLKTTEREVIDALRNEGLKTIEQMAKDIKIEQEGIKALHKEMSELKDQIGKLHLELIHTQDSPNLSQELVQESTNELLPQGQENQEQSDH